MSRLIALLFFYIAVIMLTACGGGADLVSTVSKPANTSGIETTPTDTPFMPEPYQAMPTGTAAAYPTETPTMVPTITPSLDEQFPDPAQFKWLQIVSGFSTPIGLVSAGDGSDRLFVLEQAGQVRVIREQEHMDEPFLEISEQVICCGERGLLGLAFHPNFPENGYLFVNYTDLNGDTVIARFEVSDDPDKTDPTSELKLLVLEQPYGNHNGGGLAFGPDGYLYIALGDGGSGGDPLGNAQNTSSLLGKLLRIDVNKADGYGIPADNPYVGGGGAPEVWATGLRNPWRFSFDRQTGDLFIGDVGQQSWEEIDYLPDGSPGGANFGWNYREGSRPFRAVPADEIDLTDPVAEYGRDQGYSVIGGAVYRGEQLPDLGGIYFYGDYGSGNIWGLYPDRDGFWQNRLLFQTGSRITSFGEDEHGELYYVAEDGGLYQLVHD